MSTFFTQFPSPGTGKVIYRKVVYCRRTKQAITTNFHGETYVSTLHDVIEMSKLLRYEWLVGAAVMDDAVWLWFGHESQVEKHRVMADMMQAVNLDAGF